MKCTEAGLGDNTNRPNVISDPNSGASADASFTQRIVELDGLIAQKLSAYAASIGGLHPLLIFLEVSCHGVPWLLGTVIAIIMSHQIEMHQKLLNLFLILVVDIGVVATLKAIVRRKRPSHNQADMLGTFSVDRFSFPSGHATRAAAVTFFFTAHIVSGTLWVWALIMWVTLVAVSRVLLGRHHVFDVLAGVIIGGLQYSLTVRHLWLSSDTCQQIIRPIQEELHL